MKDLVIRLGGEIERSNFDEWRSTFVARLRSIKTDLETDEDFGDAAQLVKELKSGEDALKTAKASAMDQSSDIQRLFAAIDEVAEAARQTRLTLQRQIKQRKQDLKDQVIDEGVATVRGVIAGQSLDFQRLDAARYLDRAHFVQAIKGKASIKGVKAAIREHCGRVQRAIEEKAAQVSDNGALLAGLPSEQQVLFQDRGHLLDMRREQLVEVIDRRLVTYREEQQRKALSVQPAPAPGALSTDKLRPTLPASSESPAEFHLTIQLSCTKSEAQAIARSVREHLQGVHAVKEMHLTAAPKTFES